VAWHIEKTVGLRPLPAEWWRAFAISTSGDLAWNLQKRFIAGRQNFRKVNCTD